MSGETILIVDDSPTILKVVASNLMRAGYDVATAKDGHEGIEVAEKVNPNMILLDFVMPRMNGFQFCRALREKEELAQIPIVLMSAKGDKIGDKFIQQMGAVDSITKPFSPEALLAVSDHVLKKYRDGTGVIRMDEVLDEEDLTGEKVLPDQEGSAVWERFSDAESYQASEVAEQIAARVADILTNALANLSDLGDEIEDALSKRLDLKALETISQDIAQLEPTAGKAAFAGDIKFIPLPEIFQMLQIQRQTGCFEVSQDKFRVMVFLNEGLIDLALSRDARSEFLLGRFMVEEEIIGRTELDLLLRDTDPHDPLLGQRLVKKGYLSEDDLRRVLERQTCELVYEVLRWERGRFAFRPEVLSKEAKMAQLGLYSESILLEGYRRVDEWRLIEQKIEDFDVVFECDEDALLRFGKDRLTNEEEGVLKSVDGKRSIREIIDLMQMSSFLVSKLLYRLLSVNLIRKSE